MALWKVTHFFESFSTGWSETWYLDGPTTQGQTVARREALLTARRKLLGSRATVKLKWERLVNLDNPGETYLYNWGNVTYTPAVNSKCDDPWTGVLTRLTTANGSRRMFLMRGTPASIAGTEWSDPPEGAWMEAFVLWAAEITGGSFWVMRTSNRDLVKRPVLDLGIDAVSKNVVVTSTDNPDLADGQKVKLIRVKSSPCLRGVYKIKLISSTVFHLLGTNRGKIQFNGSGEYSGTGIVILPIEGVQVLRMGEHQTGRPFGLLAGQHKRCCR